MLWIGLFLAFFVAVVLIFGSRPRAPKAVVPDKVKVPAEPREDITIISDRLLEIRNDRPYRVEAMLRFLELLRKHEAGKGGYNADFRNDDRWTLTNKTFNQVRTLGRSQVKDQGEPSSAIGGYQFITATLDSLKKSLKLTGMEVMVPIFQDDLAIALMIRRGLMEYLRGKITITEFGNRLAQEWASLPVLSTMYRGQKRIVRGQSYYAGDGLNRALVPPETVEGILLDLKKQSWL